MLNFVSGGPILDRFTRQETEMIECRLFSMHETYAKNVIKWLGMLKNFDRHPKHMMLDSGAFTAWNKGKHTTVAEVLEAYGKFFNAVEQNNVKFDSVVMISLDVIPGKKGQSATLEEIEAATKQSDINTAILQKEFGDKILPVFHQDESERRLREVMKQAEYICLSPRNDVAEIRRSEWAVWAHNICRGNKTHGLATTGINMTYDSPWYSVDSASWVHLAIYGKIYLLLNNRYQMMNVSENSSFINDSLEHYATVTPHEKEFIEDEVKKYGFTMEEVMTHFRPRALINIAVMNEQATRARNHTARRPAQGKLFEI